MMPIVESHVSPPCPSAANHGDERSGRDLRRLDRIEDVAVDHESRRGREAYGHERVPGCRRSPAPRAGNPRWKRTTLRASRSGPIGPAKHMEMPRLRAARYIGLKPSATWVMVPGEEQREGAGTARAPRRSRRRPRRAERRRGPARPGERRSDQAHQETGRRSPVRAEARCSRAAGSSPPPRSRRRSRRARRSRSGDAASRCRACDRGDSRGRRAPARAPDRPRMQPIERAM